MQGRTVLAGLVFIVNSAAVSAMSETDCASVVTATVAEIKAGAGDRWSQPIENLVRAAAGSACVKAVSGRYLETSLSTVESSMDAGPHAVALDEAKTVPEDSATASSDTDTGFTFKPLSGSPARKPYERQRQTDDN